MNIEREIELLKEEITLLEKIKELKDTIKEAEKPHIPWTPYIPYYPPCFPPCYPYNSYTITWTTSTSGTDLHESTNV